MLTMQKVTSDNVWKLLKLSVREDQRSFVATNTQSIVEAYTCLAENHVALPFGLYEDDRPVGFAMFGYGTLDDEDEPEIAKDNYCFWRLMIDKNQQGNGYGRQAMRLGLEYLATCPCGPAEYVWISYEPENVPAKTLYASMGFRENGEKCGEETVAVRPLRDPVR